MRWVGVPAGEREGEEFRRALARARDGAQAIVLHEREPHPGVVVVVLVPAVTMRWGDAGVICRGIAVGIPVVGEALEAIDHRAVGVEAGEKRSLDTLEVKRRGERPCE